MSERKYRTNKEDRNNAPSFIDLQTDQSYSDVLFSDLRRFVLSRVRLYECVKKILVLVMTSSRCAWSVCPLVRIHLPDVFVEYNNAGDRFLRLGLCNRR